MGQMSDRSNKRYVQRALQIQAEKQFYERMEHQLIDDSGVLQLFVNFTATSPSKFYTAGVLGLPFPMLRHSIALR